MEGDWVKKGEGTGKTGVRNCCFFQNKITGRKRTSPQIFMALWLRKKRESATSIQLSVSQESSSGCHMKLPLSLSTDPVIVEHAEAEMNFLTSILATYSFVSMNASQNEVEDREGLEFPRFLRTPEIQVLQEYVSGNIKQSTGLWSSTVHSFPSFDPTLWN
ncbi:protein eva-1 homolog A isoform X5 [Heterocephalus glaber]|uniref:Protein eva-1 homolog A isoform X5 n=1 Tax=Heterocephalus glaber TaxID=10181 RepID=A0AAX6QTQ7_HETGA|nr:protein eva-1 homolog A isoform X5 [Heterocephalus glaber]